MAPIMTTAMIALLLMERKVICWLRFFSCVSTDVIFFWCVLFCSCGRWVLFNFSNFLFSFSISPTHTLSLYFCCTCSLPFGIVIPNSELHLSSMSLSRLCILTTHYSCWIWNHSFFIFNILINPSLLLYVRKIPYLHTVHLEGRMSTPCWQPLPLVIVELRRSSGWGIWPRLRPYPVREVPWCSPHRQVNDEVELPIERSILVGGVGPWVVSVGEPRPLPVAHLGMVDLQDLIIVSVQIGIEDFVVPVQPIGVEVISQRACLYRFLRMSLLKLIGGEVRSPMKGRAKGFGPSTRVVQVAPALHHVDLSTRRPLPVLIVPREQPDGRPQPVTLRQLRLHLHSPICERERVNCGQLPTHHRVDVVVAIWSPFAPIEVVAGALVGGWASP